MVRIFSIYYSFSNFIYILGPQNSTDSILKDLKRSVTFNYENFSAVMENIGDDEPGARSDRVI